MKGPFNYNPFDDPSGQQFLGWLQQHGGLPFNALGAGIGVKFYSVDVDLVAQQDGNGLVTLVDFYEPTVGAIPLFTVGLVTETPLSDNPAFPGVFWTIGSQPILQISTIVNPGRVLQVTDSDNLSAVTTPLIEIYAADMQLGNNFQTFTSGKLKVGLWYLGML